MKLKQTEVLRLAEQAGLVFGGRVLPRHLKAITQFAALCIQNADTMKYEQRHKKEPKNETPEILQHDLPTMQNSGTIPE